MMSDKVNGDSRRTSAAAQTASMRPQGEKWAPISLQRTVLRMARRSGPKAAGRLASYAHTRTRTWQGASVVAAAARA